MDLWHKIFPVKLKNKTVDDSSFSASSGTEGVARDPRKDPMRVLIYRECDRRGRKLLYDSATLRRVQLPNPELSDCSNTSQNNLVQDFNTIKVSSKSVNVAKNSQTTDYIEKRNNTEKYPFLNLSGENRIQSKSVPSLSGSAGHNEKTTGWRTASEGSGAPRRDGKPQEKFAEVRNGYGYKYLKESPDAKKLGEFLFGSVALAYRGPTCKIHRMGPDKLVWSATRPAPRATCKETSSQNNSFDPCDSGLYSMSQGPFSPSLGNKSSFESAFGGLAPHWGHKNNSGQFTISEDRFFSGPEERGSSAIIGDSGIFISGPPSPYASKCGSYLHSGAVTPSGDSRSGSGSSLKNSSSFTHLQRRFLKDITSSLQSFQSNSSLGSNGSSIKLAVALVITMEGDMTEEWIFSQAPHIGAFLSSMEASVERAYDQRSTFVSDIYNAVQRIQQALKTLISGPRIACPLWPCLGTPNVPEDEKRDIRMDAISSLRSLLQTAESKQTNFFFSKVLSSVLTHHLGWVATVRPPIKRGANDDPLNTKDWTDQHAKNDTCVPSHKKCRTVVKGKDRTLVVSLVKILSYFIRCPKVTEMEFEDCPWDNVLQDVCAQTIIPDNSSINEVDMCQDINEINRKTCLEGQNEKSNLSVEYLDHIQISEPNLKSTKSYTSFSQVESLTNSPELKKGMYPKLETLDTLQLDKRDTRVNVKGKEFNIEIESGGKVLFILGDNDKLEGLKETQAVKDIKNIKEDNLNIKSVNDLNRVLESVNDTKNDMGQTAKLAEISVDKYPQIVATTINENQGIPSNQFISRNERSLYDKNSTLREPNKEIPKTFAIPEIKVDNTNLNVLESSEKISNKQSTYKTDFKLKNEFNLSRISSDICKTSQHPKDCIRKVSARMQGRANPNSETRISYSDSKSPQNLISELKTQFKAISKSKNQIPMSFEPKNSVKSFEPKNCFPKPLKYIKFKPEKHKRTNKLYPCLSELTLSDMSDISGYSHKHRRIHSDPLCVFGSQYKPEIQSYNKSISEEYKDISASLYSHSTISLDNMNIHDSPLDINLSLENKDTNIIDNVDKVRIKNFTDITHYRDTYLSKNNSDITEEKSKNFKEKQIENINTKNNEEFNEIGITKKKFSKTTVVNMPRIKEKSPKYEDISENSEKLQKSENQSQKSFRFDKSEKPLSENSAKLNRKPLNIFESPEKMSEQFQKSENSFTEEIGAILSDCSPGYVLQGIVCSEKNDDNPISDTFDNESIAIVADIDRWDVNILSDHVISKATIAPLVSQLCDLVHEIVKHNTTDDEIVFSSVESQLRNIYLKSLLFSSYIMERIENVNSQKRKPDCESKSERNSEIGKFQDRLNLEKKDIEDKNNVKSQIKLISKEHTIPTSLAGDCNVSTSKEYSVPTPLGNFDIQTSKEHHIPTSLGDFNVSSLKKYNIPTSLGDFDVTTSKEHNVSTSLGHSNVQKSKELNIPTSLAGDFNVPTSKQHNIPTSLGNFDVPTSKEHNIPTSLEQFNDPTSKEHNVPTSIYDLSSFTSILNVDVADFPLLFAIASHHTPKLASMVTIGNI